MIKMNYTNEQLVQVIKNLAQQIANLNIDKASLEVRLDEALKTIQLLTDKQSKE
jgi:hypothetical protein